ncbi:MAG: NAD(P)-binding domain-containing protein [Candidatus Omnitrophica bacterium]|nr:NAD(P)-binding domain-containing protein [Candidatus Omnitrophota bacterium]
MSYTRQARDLLKVILNLAKAENKLSGFCISNTAKIDKQGLYFTPVRNTPRMVIAGVVVYSEKQAIEIAEIVDGKVDYILVDAEKKVSGEMSVSGVAANVERSVREILTKSKLWVYKGNDLAVEALDSLLSYLTKDSLRGVGAKKIAIIGAGNLGCKLALKLVERGAHVFITRRDRDKVASIARVLNYIKPRYTNAEVVGTVDNEAAAKNADILIGMTQGIPVITEKIIANLSTQALIIDGGKGTFYPAAIKMARERGIEIYRLDVSSAFEGAIATLFSLEDAMKNRIGRRLLYGEPIVAGGLMGREGDVVVDSIFEPKIIYGIANGKGDFIRNPSSEQLVRIEKVKKAISLELSAKVS